jgi:hypothetical protein
MMQLQQMAREDNTHAIQKLHRWLLVFSLFNLLVVALTGLFLRSYPFISFPLTFKNVLHGHSHFAFGGWVMPVLLSLMLRYLPVLRERIAYRHWRNVALLLLISAYGMLFSFPVGGYQLVSITFSTISVLAGFYLAFLTLKAVGRKPGKIYLQFINWAMFYGVLSSLGPFLTGPLIAMGMQGSPIYFNSVYFYLHFQYNGLFLFLILGLVFRIFLPGSVNLDQRKFFLLMNTGLVASFALSLLWNKPAGVFYWIGGAGALMQLAALFYLFRSFKEKFPVKRGSWLLIMLIIFFIVKLFIQVASAFPMVASAAFAQKNLIVAYLHMVLLGIVTLFVFWRLYPLIRKNKFSLWGLFMFLAGFLLSESLLVIQSLFSIIYRVVPAFYETLFFVSILFPLGVFMINAGLSKRRKATYPRIKSLSPETANFTKESAGAKQLA